MNLLSTQKKNRARRLAVWLTLAMLMTLCTSVAIAHARLLRSQPAAGARLEQPPKIIELWFSEELEPSMSTISVTDRAGKHVDKSGIFMGEGNRKLQIDLEELVSGTYTVGWKALSTDEHTMKGKFTFTVALAGNVAGAQTIPPHAPAQNGQQPVPTPPAATSQQTPSTESTQESGTPWTMSVVRWFECMAMMALFGGFAFCQLVLRPTFRRAHGLESDERARAFAASVRQFITLSRWALILLALSTLIALVLQTATVTDTSVGEALSPARLYQVVARTSYGGPWLLQAATVGVAAVILYLLGRRSNYNADYGRDIDSIPRPEVLWAGVAVTTLTMLAPSMAGHARAAAAEYHFTVFSDWLHLVAAGFWVGGLFHLTLTMTRGVSGLQGPQRLRVLDQAIPLFTRLAIASTVVIALTGVYNSWIHIDRLSALWTTAYGEALLVKIIIFIVMVALGGLNTFILHPRAKRLISDEGAAATHEQLKLDRSFYRSVGLEAVLGAVVLIAASVLVFLQPAREPSITMTHATSPNSTVGQDRR